MRDIHGELDVDIGGGSEGMYTLRKRKIESGATLGEEEQRQSVCLL